MPGMTSTYPSLGTTCETEVVVEEVQIPGGNNEENLSTYITEIINNYFNSFITNTIQEGDVFTYITENTYEFVTPELAIEQLIIECSDETTELEVGTAVVTFRMGYAFTVTDVRASLTTAATGAAFQVDINESGTSILSTKLTIDAGEKTSTTAATPRVISDTAIADDAEITIDIDQIGSTVAGAGLKVTIIGYKTT